MSQKVQKSLLLLFLCFSSPVLATSLLETTTAVGIANTLQNTAQQKNPRQILNNVKKTVNQIPNAQSLTVDSNPLPQRPLPQRPLSQRSLPPLLEEDLRASLSDKKISPRSPAHSTVKYDSKAIIFYKKDCEFPLNGCKRSQPIFTNLKSVMFDYDQNRMNFQK